MKPDDRGFHFGAFSFSFFFSSLGLNCRDAFSTLIMCVRVSCNKLSVIVLFVVMVWRLVWSVFSVGSSTFGDDGGEI